MEFNVEPYWDDFDATNGALEKNYMRILFRPGYAVQARELTQIQSILQNQIKQFGDHIFKDGSPVVGGHLTIDTGVTYLKLEAQDTGGQDLDLENFLGVTVYNTGSPKTRAKVLQTYDTTTDRTLMIRYLRGAGFTQGQTLQTAAGFTANVVSTTDYTGKGSTVTINQGVFYVNGFFVTVLPQTIVLDPYSATPTFRIGLEIDEEIVTESVDNALLDPAQESFNYQAPGAHRYQFALNLAKRAIDSIDDSRFFELLRVENGIITKQVSYPIYSELEKTLARRTYDESGNYEVQPFRINLSANTPAGLAENTSTFIVNIEPGKAYVKGFEFETIGTTKLPSTRARTSTQSKEYDLSVYYGNRIYLNNLQGSAAGLGFSDLSLNEVDIHCVSNNQVILDGTTSKYYSTRIGTAKIKNLDRVTSNLFNMYLTDINFLPIVGTAGATTNTTAINLGSEFSATNNAYQNCTITIINNAGSVGNTAKITSYDGTSKVAYISPPIRTSMLKGSVFSITIPGAFARSVIIPNASTFTSANLQANVAEIGIGRDTLGNTIYEDSNFDRMLFKIPNYYVKYDSDKNVEFYRRILKSSETFSVNGAATITLTGQTFDFGSDGALVSSADRSENIIVVAKTGANAGKIIDMTVGDRSALRTDSQTLTLYTSNGSGTAFTGDVYVTTKITNANGSYRRVKTLIESNNEITAGDTLASATSVTGYTSVKINPSNGTVWFTSANVINKTPFEPTSLFLSDVVRVNKIYDSGSLSFAPNTTNKIDITDRYLFDSGQSDNYYDHATVTLKAGSQPPSGQTVVFVDYYTHTGTGYLSQKSYANTQYENERIPIYKSQTGQLYNLRDVIDMRPLRVSGIVANPYKTIPLGPTVNVASGGLTITANTARAQNVLSPPLVTGSVIKINNEYRTIDTIDNSTQIRVTKAFSSACTNGVIELVTDNLQVTGGMVQRPTDAMTMDYEYYLPRIDKVVATKDKEFKLIQGVPSLAPTEPVEPEDSMPIYTMYLPPYTASLKSVDLKRIENRRYTMKDISVIDKRVAQLEDYVRLKESEKQIISNPPKSPETPTVNKPIYGTIVDEFNDLTVADTTPSGDFAASIEKGLLSCAKVVKSYSLEPTVWSQGDKLFMLNYTETPFASQSLYSNTSAETVQTGIIAKFEGFASLSPERDYYYSQTIQPYISDSGGRYIEVNQPEPQTPVLFDKDEPVNIVEDVGGGGYQETKYTEPVIVSQEQPIDRGIRITVPDWSGEPYYFTTPEYIDRTIDYTPTVVGGNAAVISVDINTAPDTVTTSNVAAINLASFNIGDLIQIGDLTDQFRYISYIEPDGSFLQVNTNFSETATSVNIANVAITETYTPVVESSQLIVEPYFYKEINIDFTAIMPETYLNDIWAPPPIDQIPTSVEPPIFAPAWLEETIIAPTFDLGFDQFYGLPDYTGYNFEGFNINLNF